MLELIEDLKKLFYTNDDEFIKKANYLLNQLEDVSSDSSIKELVEQDSNDVSV